ncbi:PP2C family protein-serine/threonine phosphatase [Gemmatimonadota bacterium]
MATGEAAASGCSENRKPRNDEIDVFGLTHRGKLREENQDHFLICSLRKQLDVAMTSLPDPGSIQEGTDRLAFLAMVADGVGGGPGGEEASRRTLAGVTRYVTESMLAYYTADSSDDEAFSKALSDAALRCAEDLRQRGEENPEWRKMATTLSLWIGVWPRAYLLQVGDSRYYMLRRGKLTQVSRDQTVAQDLVDQGVISRAAAPNLPWSNVLSSAIGGSATTPVVTSMDNDWENVHLLCSDGLVKHVSDERIEACLGSMTSARQACESLLEEALEAGGSDNISMIVARAVRRDLP